MYEKFFMFLFGSCGGGYCILASIFNWDFFFNNDKGRTFVNILGRTGARIFYCILGLCLVLLAIYAIFLPLN